MVFKRFSENFVFQGKMDKIHDADSPGKKPTASPHHISVSLSPDDFQELFQTNKQE
jgi:hypothetical protein